MQTDEGTYFFLSYAHPSPLRGLETERDTDVRKFFADLTRRLREVTGTGPDRELGFLDAELSPGEDWDQARGRALSVAQVFVPLYSPTYFRNAWTLSELRWFEDRLAHADPRQAREHILPVLWDPLPPWADPVPTRAALAVAPDSEAYRQDGLRALSRFSMHKKEYEDVLGRIAAAIGRVAGEHRLAASPAPPRTPAPIPPDVAQFVVVVAAPARAQAPAGRADAYGDDPAAWRPFRGDDTRPAAEYVASTAERLSLATYVTDFAGVGDLLQTRPAVVLIDPWVLAADWDDDRLGAALEALPSWAVPVVAGDDADRGDPRSSALAERVEAMLQSAHRPPAQQLHGLPEFVSGMPRLINEARHLYLKNGPGIGPGQSSSPRLRLISGGQPSEPSI